MPDQVHHVRNSIASGERTFTLAEGAMCWTEPGRPGRCLAYVDIREMQLISYASPIGQALQCMLRSRSGEKVKLRSAHYRGLGDFEDCAATYVPFVRALAAQIAAAAPEATFVAGSTGLWILWLAVGLIWLSVLAIFSLAIFDLPLLESLAVALGLGAVCVPLIWHEVSKGGARTFDPKAPHAALLGAAR